MGRLQYGRALMPGSLVFFPLPPFTMVQFSALSMAALSVFSLAAVGGGVSYAAKDAHPGDLLYGVHTTVYGDAATNAEEEMEDMQSLHDDLLNLQVRGALSADARADVISKYEAHVNAAQEAIVELEALGKIQEATSLSAMLQAKAAVFNSMIMGASSSSTSSGSSTSSDEGSSSSDHEEGDDDSSSSYSGLHIESSDSASVSADGEANSNVNVDVNADASATVNIH